jgi:hypothetical protein
MRDLDRRLHTLEVRQHQGQAGAHFIAILQFPWDLHAEDEERWLAEQLACDCRPNCPGKRVGALLPEKAPSAEAWAERCRQWPRTRDPAAEAAAWYARYTGEEDDETQGMA